jgi:protoporphyrinogen/coproporphyrinogen III oxidase
VIVVVGGGITGLAAAYELTRRSLPFVLLEASDRVGGLIRTEQDAGFTIDAGPDSVLVQKPAALQLCSELGLSSRLMQMRPPRRAFVVKRGRLHPLPSPSVLGLPTTLLALAGYDLLGPAARMRLALEPFVPRRPRADESVASFFSRRFGRATVDLIASPLLGGIHAGDIDRLSMASLFPRLVLAERKSGKVLHSLSRAPKPGSEGLFRALRSGMGELVATIESRLPAASVRLGAYVTGLDRGSAAWHVTTHSDRTDAQAVVIAAPAHAAAAILRPIDTAAADICASVEYVSTLSVALGYRRSEIPHPLEGSGFVVSRRYNDMRITACTWVSSKWEHRVPDGHALLRAFMGGAHDPNVVEATDDDVIETAQRDLASVLGPMGSPVLARVYRWPRAAAQHNVGHRTRMKELSERLRALPGLFVAGSGFDAIGIPDCIAQGRSAASAAAAYVSGRVPQ